MTYRGNYIPKRKKVNYKRVVPFIIVLAIIIGIIIGKLLKPEAVPTKPGYAFCNMTDRESQSIAVNNLNESTVVMQDYSVYGDSLTFYDKKYDVNLPNSKISNRVILKNLCNEEEEVAYFLGNGLDSQIALSNLSPGFYEMRVYEGFERKRIISEEVMDVTLNSASINGESNQVKILANKDLFEVEGMDKLDKNYVFLEVKKTVSNPDKYDVILDPNGLYDDGSGYIYPGLVINGFHEANDMYNLAKSVQTELTSRGYRVALSRDGQTPISIHGEEGRIFKAYQQEAKYYIHFTMLYDTRPNTRGATVIYSNFSTSKFAEIMRNQLAKTNLSLYDFGVGTTGITQTGKFEGLDYNAILRETGGTYTGAGTVNERYQKINAFAKDKNKGIQSLIIELGYASNPETMNVLNNEYDSIITAIADGIEMQLNQE